MFPDSRSLAWHATPCLVLLGLVVRLWNLASGRVPNPWEIATLVGLCVIGSGALTAYALIRARSMHRLLSAGCILTGVFTTGAVAVFVMVVLSNDDADVAVFFNAKKPPAGIKQFRLFNLNVDHGYPAFEAQEERFRQTVDELQRLQADVIVLQEVWNTNHHGNMAHRLAKALGFNYAYARANGSLERIGFEEGAAVVSRFPILDAHRVRLKPRRPIWETRIAIVAKFDLGDETLTLAGLHLSNSEAADDQAEHLVEILREHLPDIIIGDFNSRPASRAMKALANKGFIEAIPKNATAMPWIDHVFLSPAFHQRWEIKEASWIIATQPVPGVRGAISDHDGIIVDLRRR